MNAKVKTISYAWMHPKKRPETSYIDIVFKKILQFNCNKISFSEANLAFEWMGKISNQHFAQIISIRFLMNSQVDLHKFSFCGDILIDVFLSERYLKVETGIKTNKSCLEGIKVLPRVRTK